jgi:hypothetical protein
MAVVTQLHPVPVQVEPPEALAVRQFVDDHLVTFDSVGWQSRVRQRERTFSLGDDDFASAFELVPEAHALAKSMRESYLRGMRVFTIGSLVEVAGLLGATSVLVASVATTVAVGVGIGLALAFAAVTLVGAVISLFALPDLSRSHSQLFEVVSLYNHGLTRRPITVLPAMAPPAAAPVLELQL